ncbi:MAG: HRDC domain-containing protein, partial [Alphaproteobacteria bacterium]|nr:HRDC domain-containing protein [Alphaproteobacteria bacterium]
QLASIAGTRPASLDELRGLEDIRDWQVRLYGEELLEEVRSFEAMLEASGSSKRRRRRRRRNDAE